MARLRYPDIPSLPRELQQSPGMAQWHRELETFWNDHVRVLQRIEQGTTATASSSSGGTAEQTTDPDVVRMAQLDGIVSRLDGALTGVRRLFERLRSQMDSSKADIDFQIRQLQAQSGDASARITNLGFAYADGDRALAFELSTVSAAVDDVASEVSTIALTYVSNTAFDDFTADLGLQLGGITDSIDTLDGEVGGIALTLSTLSTSVDGIDATVDILAAAYIVGGVAVSTWGFKLDANGKVVGIQAVAASGGVQDEEGVITFIGADMKSDNYVYGTAGWFLGYDGSAKLANADFWGRLRAGRMASGIPRYNETDPVYETHTHPTTTTKTTASKVGLDSGGGPVLIVHYKGWKEGPDGYSRDRYGRSDTIFSLRFSGVVDHYVSLWWRHRWPDGSVGSWVYVPNSEQTEPQAGIGSISTHADFTPPGLDGEAGVEFGVRGTDEFGNFHNAGARDVRGALSVQAFND